MAALSTRSMFLHPQLVRKAFTRLAPLETSGKQGQECTSAILYLLAFERVRKLFGCADVLDFDPDSSRGRDHRNALALEFAKLSTLANSQKIGEFLLALNLGEVATDAIAPEKRISSNFLTTPLKRASLSATASTYPNRKHGPTFYLGKLHSSSRWCIQAHSDYLRSLRSMLSDRRSLTPFTDLAVFVFRNQKVSRQHGNLAMMLKDMLVSHYCADFAEAFAAEIDREKAKIKNDVLLLNKYENPFGASVTAASTGVSLEERITYLENLLVRHGIPFN